MLRIQLEFPKEKIEQLDKLKTEVGIRTWKELINNALTLLVWAVREIRAGRVIASVDENRGSYKEILLPALEHLKEQAIKEADAQARGVMEETEELQPSILEPSRAK